MTEFQRAGFWRTSKLGNTHWVSDHLVNRDSWSGSEPAARSNPLLQAILTTNRAARGAVARYVTPNADCPVCGAPVYFYQNEFGSRVFFDELGPPWPKHPCTDQPASEPIAARAERNRVVEPVPRDLGQRRLLARWLAEADIDREVEFGLTYREGCWPLYSVLGRFRGGPDTLIVLSSVNEDAPRLLYLSASRLPRSVAVGTMVFVWRRRLAYFDRNLMVPEQILVDRLRSASAFVEALVTPLNSED